MKVTKTYQHYRQDVVFGIVSSEQPKVIYLPGKKNSNICIVGAGESVLLWNLFTTQLVTSLQRTSGSETVSCIGATSDTSGGSCKVGVGYTDGWVNVFDTETGEVESHFRAGRSRVSAIDIFHDTLVCAADSEIHVLDIVSGSGSRMKGHRGVITRLNLIRNGEILFSSAQDTFIKMWDLKSHHCFATLTGHSGPVWDFTLTPDLQLLISGSSDSQLRVWRLNHTSHDECETVGAPVADTTNKTDDVLVMPLSEHRSLIRTEFLGCVQRNGVRRTHCLGFDSTGTFLVCQSFERNVEVFRLLDQEGQNKRLRKKMKKAKEKNCPFEDVKLEVSDILRPVLRITLAAKPSSCAVSSARPCWKNGVLIEHRLRFVCTLKNNSIEELEMVLPAVGPSKARNLQVVKTEGKGTYVRLLNHISAPGHRTTPIACSLTADGLGVFTLARTESKLWNRRTGSCLATLSWKMDTSREFADVNTEESQNTLPTKASAFVLAPGDRHVVIGFESGHLLLFDVNSKSIRQSIANVHAGAVRGLALTGDKKGIISGGSDKQIAFYNFDLNIPSSGPPGLCLIQSRTSEFAADQITCLAASPNNRLIVLGLVNFHVDVYFADSFKRVHSLYGHAAPVTSLDISSDSRLIITGSGDKTVRLWELQFGNCQRRFTTHMEPVTCVRFIPHTKLAVSCDMAGMIKQWDTSKLREVATLKGHDGAVTCLSAVATNATFLARHLKESRGKKAGKRSKRGQDVDDDDNEDENDDDEFEDLCGGVIVSCGRDFSVRVWTESEELLILEEQAELAREAAEDEELVRSEALIPGAIPAEASETGLLGRPTPNTRDAADMLMEAMDIYDQEVAKQLLISQGKPAAPPHPLMVVRGTDCPERFLLASLAALRAPSTRLGGGGAGLEHTLGAITTEHARRLLPRLADWLSRGWEVELVGRAIRHLATLHFGLIVTSADMREVLQRSREARLQTMAQTKSLIGANLAGLNYLKTKIEENNQTVLFEELLTERDKRIRKQKAKRSKMALLLPG